MQIVWLSSFEIGVEEIDSDHKAIFSLLSEMNQHLDDGNSQHVCDLMDAFLQTVSEHFGREIAILSQSGFPDVLDHAVDHRHLLDRLKNIRRECGEGANIAQMKDKFRDVSQALIDDIICGDLSFKSYLQEKRDKLRDVVH